MAFDPWPGKGMISLEEISAYCTSASEKVLRGMIARGELRGVRLGRVWHVPRADLERVGIVDPVGATAASTIPGSFNLLPAEPALSARDEAMVREFLSR
jgi:hypothetical protein